MAKNSIRDYSNTAASNTDVQNVNIDEGCAPSGINNAIREVMADLADVNDGTIALETPVADSFSTDTISEKTAATGVTIDGVLLKDSEVTTDTINEKTSAAGVTIDGVLLKDSKLDGSYITDATIDADSLASNAVTTAKIADDAVTADKLANTNVTAGDYGDSYSAADITVDAQGRITAASTNSFSKGWELLSDDNNQNAAITRSKTGISDYEVIKVVAASGAGGSAAITIKAGDGNYNNTLATLNSVSGRPAEVNLVIYNFNDGMSGGDAKVVEQNGFTQSGGDYEGYVTDYFATNSVFTTNDNWDRIQVAVTGNTNNYVYIFGMRTG